MLLAEEKATLATTSQKSAKEAREQRDRAESAESETRQRLYASTLPTIAQTWTTKHDAQQLERLLDEFSPTATSADLRGFEWWYLNHEINQELLVLGGPQWPCASAAFLNDSIIAVAGPGHVSLCDIANGHVLQTLASDPTITYELISCGGRTFVAALNGYKIGLWHLENSQLSLVREFAQQTDLLHDKICLSSDGEKLLYNYRLQEQGTAGLCICNLVTGAIVERVAPATVDTFAPSPNGRQIAWYAATGGDVRDVEIIDMDSGDVLATLDQGNTHVFNLEFSPDGSKLVAGIDGGVVRVWDSHDGSFQRTFTPKLGEETSPICWIPMPVFSPDSRMLAIGNRRPVGGPHFTQIWDVVGGKALATYSGAKAATRFICFSSDARIMAVGTDDGRLRVYRVAPNSRFVDAGPTSPPPRPAVSALCFDSSSSLLAAGSEGGKVRVFDLTKSKECADLGNHKVKVTALALDADCDRLVSGDSQGDVQVRALSDGHVVTRVSVAPNSVTAALLVKSDSSLWIGTNSGLINVYATESGQKLGTLARHNGPVNTLVSGPSNTVASAGNDGQIHLWNVDSREWHRSIRISDPISSLRFSKDGNSVAYGSVSVVKAARIDVATEQVLDKWSPIGTQPNHAWLFFSDLRSFAFMRTHADFGISMLCDWHTSTHGDIEHHGGCIGALSPNDQWLAYGHTDGTVSLWHPTEEAHKHLWKAHAEGFTALAAARKSHQLAAATVDGRIELLNGDDGTRVRDLDGHSDTVDALRFSPDDQLLASGGVDGIVKLWNVADGTKKGELPRLPFPIRSLDFSGDGATLAVGAGDTDYRSHTTLWNLASLEMKRECESSTTTERTSACREIGFLGDHLAVVQGDWWANIPGGLKIWPSTPTSKPISLGSQSLPVLSLGIAHNNSLFAAGGQSGEVVLWDFESRAVVGRLQADTSPIFGVAFSPKDDTLVTSGLSKEIRLWDVEQRRLRGTLPVRSPVRRLRWSQTGETIWALTWDAELLRLSAPRQSRPIVTERNANLVPPVILTASPPRAIPPEPFRIAQGQPLSALAIVSRPPPVAGLRSWSIEPSNHAHQVNVVITDSHDNMISSGSQDCSIRIWNEHCQLQKVLLGHTRPVYALALSQDGNYLASGSGDATLRIWERESGRCLRVIKVDQVVQGVTWSPNERQVLVCGGRLLRQYDIFSSKALKAAKTDRNWIRACWSPDGRHIVSLDDRGSLIWWDATTLQQVDEIRASDNRRASAVRFSPDGKHIAIAKEDGHILVWNAETRALEATLRGKATSFFALDWASDSRRLAASGTHFAVWDVMSQSMVVEQPCDGLSFGCGWLSRDRHLGVGMLRSIRIYDTVSGDEVARTSPAGVQLADSSYSRISPDGKTLLVRNRSTLSTWDLKSGDRLSEWQNLPGDRDEFSPNGQWLASFSRRKGENAWVSESRSPAVRKHLEGHAHSVTCLAWSPTSEMLATGDEGGELCVWNTEGALIRRVSCSAPIAAVAWSVDAKRIAAAQQQTVDVLNASTGEKVTTFEWKASITALLHCPIGWLIGGVNGRLDLCGDDGRTESELLGLNASVKSIDWNGDEVLATGHSGDTQTWRSKDRLVRKLGELGTPAQWLPSHRAVMTGPANYSPIRAYDLSRRSLLGAGFMNLPGEEYAVIGSTGHYRGSAGIADHLVFVVLYDDGRQEVVRLPEFEKRFDWRNDSTRTSLLEAP